MNDPQKLTQRYVESITEGYAFNMKAAARSIEPPAPYIAFNSNKGAENAAIREAIAAPAIVSDNIVIPDGPDCGHDALTVKYSGSWDIALPECYSFAFPLAKIMANDVLSLYGGERFKKAKISLVIQRNTMEPNTAHRPAFAGWHTHDSGRAPIDLTYQFSSVLGTEFLIAGTREDPFIQKAPKGTLLRFGSEQVHRSPQNNTGSDLRRTWGAFIVNPNDALTNYVTVNSVLRSENIERALERGKDIDAGAIRTFKKPLRMTKCSGVFIDPKTPDSLKSLFPNGLRYGFHSAVNGVFKAEVTDNNDTLVLRTENLDGEKTEVTTARDRWALQQELMKLGALPIEPINA